MRLVSQLIDVVRGMKDNLQRLAGLNRVRENNQSAAITECPQEKDDDDIHFRLDNSWSTDHALGIMGWIFSSRAPLDKVEISVDDIKVPVTSWHERPDLDKFFPGVTVPRESGFWVQFPRASEHKVTITAERDGKVWTKDATLIGQKPHRPDYSLDGYMARKDAHNMLWKEFIRTVNNNNLRVLEIGSRIVCPGSSSKRDLFPGASSYTGFDYHPDSNTDVVGDAHRLASYFRGQRFDAVFSDAVFEHLAMPWVVAAEINKVLEIGGITYHSTVFAWPAHDRPCDYWRFSDDALKVIFSRALGFEVIKAGVYNPVRIYMDELQDGQEAFPSHPAFTGAGIIARKVAEVDRDRFRWDVTLEELLGEACHYPLHNNAEAAPLPAN